jgi:hypothetical protein
MRVQAAWSNDGRAPEGGERMARVNPDEYVKKWQTRTAAASEDYKQGVMRVSQAPGSLAAAKKADYVAAVNANQNKWAANVGKVTLTEWQNMAVNKGAQNLSTGVQAAGPKMAQAAGKLLSTVDSIRPRIRSMPSGTYEQRKARMAAWADAMHAAYQK